MLSSRKGISTGDHIPPSCSERLSASFLPSLALILLWLGNYATAFLYEKKLLCSITVFTEHVLPLTLQTVTYSTQLQHYSQGEPADLWTEGNTPSSDT